MVRAYVSRELGKFREFRDSDDEGFNYKSAHLLSEQYSNDLGVYLAVFYHLLN
jgi:hypothetical protein